MLVKKFCGRRVKFIQVSAPTHDITAFIKLHSKDRHTIVVTKYLAKITHLFLQYNVAIVTMHVVVVDFLLVLLCTRS